MSSTSPPAPPFKKGLPASWPSLSNKAVPVKEGEPNPFNCVNIGGTYNQGSTTAGTTCIAASIW